jgi:hypothetical protein
METYGIRSPLTASEFNVCVLMVHEENLSIDYEASTKAPRRQTKSKATLGLVHYSPGQTAANPLAVTSLRMRLLPAFFFGRVGGRNELPKFRIRLVCGSPLTHPSSSSFRTLMTSS